MGRLWKFFRAGGFDQVKLESGADLLNLDQLDQKLWVALACPTTGLEFDARTLALIDTDQDGRIRAPELIAAVKWVGSLLKNPDDLLKGLPSLPLAAINDTTPEGLQLLSSARQILANLGKKDGRVITVEDVSDTARIFAQTRFNGDGIIVAESPSDEPTQAVIADIIACLGADNDLSGMPGVSQVRVDQFFAELTAFSDWHKKAESEAATILPLGDATATAVATVRTVKAKVDDYFARCRLAAFDPRALPALNRDEKEYLVLTAQDLSVTAQEVAGFPLARIEAEKPLPLVEAINPAWAGAVARLRAVAVKPLLGDRQAITGSEWAAITAKFGPFECWSAAKAGLAVEKLGLGRVREILSSPANATLTALIAKDKALEPEVNAVVAVDKLLRYCRDLHRLCINFVNFKDFYAGEPALFQAGTLYLDQRSCTFTLPVEDAAKHAAMAGLAGTYLAYCDCVRKGTGEKRQIVAAFTNGDSDNLMVGRNGIFYDRQGRDWDATITRIIDNPISIRQAFWSPYKKFVRLIEEQIAKRAAAAEAISGAHPGAAAANADKTKPGAPQKVDVGVVAALSVAAGTIGSAIGYFLNTIAGVKPWQLPLIFLALLLLISCPSMIIAYIKLRKRNLGPILDANGWAVNAKAKINVPFGTSLTSVAKLPPGSSIDVTDRFAEKSSVWPKVCVVLFFAWWIWAALSDTEWLYQKTHGRFGKPPAAAVPNPAAGTGTDATGIAANPAAKPSAETNR